MTEVNNTTWELDRINKLSRQQPDLVNRAIHRLLYEDKDLRWAVIVSAYLDGDFSLAKTAELLEMHPLVLREQFLRLGVPIRQGPANIDEARAEIAALEHWQHPQDAKTQQ